jgi:hypothetical protein
MHRLLLEAQQVSATIASGYHFHTIEVIIQGVSFSVLQYSTSTGIISDHFFQGMSSTTIQQRHTEKKQLIHLLLHIRRSKIEPYKAL